MIRRSLFAFFCLVFLAALPALAPTSAKAAPAKSVFSAAQKAEIENMIRSFIAGNPEVMISSVEAHYNAQTATKEKQEGRMEKMPAGLLDNAMTPAVGPKNAKIAIVEFFDYNCGFCKQVASDVARLVDEEKSSVRFIFKELPILSATSETAARYALAADKQGKYLDYHNALMAHQGPIDEAFLESTATDIGLDVAKLKKDADTQDVRDALMKNVELARILGVRGTPFFVIGKEKVPGAVGYTQMKTLLNQERNVSPAAAAPATAEPAAAAKETSSAAEAVAAPAAVDSAASPAMQDPDVQREIEKARAETKAMIDDIKQQTTELQKAQTEAAKAAAANAAKANAAKKAVTKAKTE